MTTVSSAPAAIRRPSSLVDDARRVLALIHENPGDTTAAETAHALRRAAALAIAALPPGNKTGAEMTASEQLIALFADALSPTAESLGEDRALTRAYAAKNWPGLLATMVLLPAWEWQEAPKFDAVPDWLWPVFTEYVFRAPPFFRFVGEAEKYSAHHIARVEELARWATANRGSSTVRAALEKYIGHASAASSLLLSESSLKHPFALRAKIAAAALGLEQKQEEIFAPAREGRRLRIGCASRDFGPHAATYATLPLFEHLDTERFETIFFALSATRTAVEKHSQSLASEFHLLPDDAEGQVQAIRAANVDVLLFAGELSGEIDSFYRLALHRLAPLQLVHGTTRATSGLPEIDLYVSATFNEMADAETHFTERLGLLPGAAPTFQFSIDPTEAAPFTRGMLGLPEQGSLFVVAADESAITPELRHAWARLLAAVPESRLLVHPFGLSGAAPEETKRFCAEFDRVLLSEGVQADRLIVSANAFASQVELNELLRLGDVCLDTFPCSDPSVLAHLLACGVPVVSREGKTGRARAGAALLRALNMSELVATDEKTYHDIVVRLASDAVARSELRARIENALARSPVIFDTLAASDAFGALVEAAYDELQALGTVGFRAKKSPLILPVADNLAVAKAALADGSANDAARHARAALAADPANPHARHVLGAAYMKLGRGDRAVLYLLEAVQHLETDAPAWCDLAKAFYGNGQTREAAQAIQACLRIDERHLDALLLLGEISESSGVRSDLEEISQLASAIAPEDPRVRTLVAKANGMPAPAPVAPAKPHADPITGLPGHSLLSSEMIASIEQSLNACLQSIPDTSVAAELPPVVANNPQPRALLFFLSAKESYRQPLFSTNEIFCSPDTENRLVGGRVVTVKIPAGSFDVRDVLRALPAAQQPEIVIVKADATGRNFPRNLGALKCPKVLIVGDTHHMRQPIQSLLRYAKEEPFDFVVFDHTRHHAHLFAEAGVKNVHWLPAVDYGFVPREVKRKHSRPLTFVGQAGRHHPYRCRVLDQVKSAGLPLEMLRGTLEQTADIYADSQITLNVSLNGDLNLRVFESLSAGGFLLTDELSTHSGLPQLFQAGKHLDTWRTPGELVEKIRHYLANPAEAQRIRAAGQAELLRAHHPDVKLREFYDLVFSNKVNPIYDLGSDVRCARATAKAATAPLSASDPVIVGYEKVQELHRVSSHVTVFCEKPAELGRLADLPRLLFAPLSDLGAIPPSAESAPQTRSVIWWEDADAGPLEKHLLTFSGHVIAPNASSAVIAALDTNGYSAEQASCVYQLMRPVQGLLRAWDAGEREYVRSRIASVVSVTEDSNDMLTLAHLAEQLEDRVVKSAAIERAIGLDRGNQAALISSAADSLDDKDAGGALVALEEAARVAPLTQEVEQLRAELCERFGADPALQPYYTMINRTPVPQAERPRSILLVTNLFPPQELGGYGRKMWEFAQGLVARGHQVRVLAGDLPDIAKQPTDDEVVMERSVSRELRLLGTWTKGIPSSVSDPKEVEARRRHNRRLVKDALQTTRADFLLAGNLDFLGADIVNVALEAGTPVLHALGNTAPGYAPQEQPVSPRYRIGSCSQWNASMVIKNGYSVRTEVLYPGARVDRFFRFFLPERGRLRICFAGLVMPFKGVHILVEALAKLHQAGIDFTAEIAGETTDPQFLANLHDFARKTGMADKIKYTGFLDRKALSALFARSNVLVFPSLVEEGFGISHVEALAAGLVVVSSGTGGAREIIRDEVDGLLYPSENVQMLAEKLHALATKPELFATLQAASQRRASEFAVEHSVHKIEQCMEELIAMS